MGQFLGHGHGGGCGEKSKATVMEKGAMVASFNTHWPIISEQSYLDQWKALPFL